MVRELKRIGWASDALLGYINNKSHKDNGNGSILHPLTILHYTTGDENHYTIQSSWIQSILKFKLGDCDDQQLYDISGQMSFATKKEHVKAAMRKVFGLNVGLDNLNFYPQAGGVATCSITLKECFSIIARALRRVKANHVGNTIVLKDLNWLNGRGVEFDDLAVFRLKEGQQRTWEALNQLAREVHQGRNG